MGMAVGGKGVNSQPNVTPFVDICLVLLVIFMVITPLLSRTLDVAVPPKDQNQETQPVDPTDTFILTVKGPADSPRVLLNREEIVGALDGVQNRMEELMKGRREKVVFFQSDNEVPYDYVIQVMDAMRGGGVEKIGLITDENLDATGAPQ
ncbi:MAG TPA: biopolymer transporter ExbD [Candidatus Polarisedimenticolia bacterium]|jgi:biopolymer transport protein ExbD|nr:biopolymer transporter ExbD [Candidatus Polarisedimenticolia bacterium]